MLRLETLGRLGIADLEGRVLPAQRRRLALLAVLAIGGRRGFSRDKVMALLWPEGSQENARHALEQLVHLVRRQFSEGILLGPDPLCLNEAVMACDVTEFEAAVANGRFQDAVTAYRGPFLDGFHLPDSPEFDEWREQQRSRLAEAFQGALRELANQYQHVGQPHRAVETWRRLSAEDPLSTPAAIGLIESLTAIGDRPAALRQAQIHEARLREELGAEPDARFRSLVNRLRSERDAAVAAPSAAPAIMEEPVRGTPAPPPAVKFSRFGRFAAVAAILAVSLATVWYLGHRPRNEPAERGSANRVLVAPFRVTAPDSSLNYLSEGVIDLLAVALSSPLGPGVVDPQAAIAAWRSVPAGAGSDPGWRADRAARKVGAPRVIVGEVAWSGPSRLTISAAMRSAADGRSLASFTVAGPIDSLGGLVDRLAADFQAAQSPHPDRALLTAPIPVLRAYLNGQALFRTGRYSAADESFRQALAVDSTFLPAAVGLALSSYWTGSPRDGVALALRQKDRLNPADLAVIQAIAGPRFPAPATELETLTLWDRASTIAPDQALVWFALGNRLVRWGAPLGIRDWGARSRAALLRASEIDSLLAGPLEDLLWLDLIRGDTTEVRRDRDRLERLTLGPEDADLVRWEAAAGLSDAEALKGIRSGMARLQQVILYHIALRGQRFAGGVPDAMRAAGLMDSTAGSNLQRFSALRVRHQLAMNQGKPAEGLRIAQEMVAMDPLLRGVGDIAHMPEHAGLRTMVLDGLEWNGDSASASAATRALESLAQGRAGERIALLERDLCAAAQWEAQYGGAGSAEHAIEWFETTERSNQPEPIRWFARKCSLLVRVEVAARRKDPSLDRLLAAADSLFLQGRPPFEDLEHAWLRIARIRAGLGQVGLARQALARTSPMAEPMYLGPVLALQAQLALADGDTLMALKAYHHAAALTGRPHTAPAHPGP